MKNKIIKKVKDLLSPLALPAVIYAENLIGKGFWRNKKANCNRFYFRKTASIFNTIQNRYKKSIF